MPYIESTDPARHTEGWEQQCMECDEPYPCPLAQQHRKNTGHYPGRS